MAATITGRAALPDPGEQLERARSQAGFQQLADRARAAMDARAWASDVRRDPARVAADSLRTGGLANAAFEGATLPEASLAMAGQDATSPMGRVVGAALDLASRGPRLRGILTTAPLQGLAEAATVVGRGFVPADHLGRPRSGDACDDPLHLPDLPPASAVAPQLTRLAGLLVAGGDRAVLLAAVTHAHLAVLRPFVWGSGLVARASIRWVLAARSVDPDMLCVPESGLVGVGRARYVRGLAGYRAGTSEGMGQWLTVFCQALELGAGSAPQGGSGAH